MPRLDDLFESYRRGRIEFPALVDLAMLEMAERAACEDARFSDFVSSYTAFTVESWAREGVGDCGAAMLGAIENLAVMAVVVDLGCRPPSGSNELPTRMYRDGARYGLAMRKLLSSTGYTGEEIARLIEGAPEGTEQYGRPVQ